MNEVEKVYRNAHVYPRVYRDITKETFENKAFNMADMCNEAFTAEKQIYLIKFLSDKAEYLGIHYDRYKGLFEMQTDVGGLSIKNEFEEALASRVNVLWRDLTEEERKQIKNILESEVRE